MSIPRICIQPSISSGKPTPVLWSAIEQAMRDPRIQDICDQIKLLDGNDPDELARLKRQLPVITPHACRFTNDGTRKSANAVPSGLVMLDIDHIDAPREFFSTHIFPHLGDRAPQKSTDFSGAPQAMRREAKGEENIPPIGGNEGGLYFVAITPSGHGLRIIAERNPGESIPDAQHRIASACNIPEYDSVTTDLARASFLMPWSYVLYCEPNGLDFKDEDAYPQPLPERRGAEAQNTTLSVTEDNSADNKSLPLGGDLGEASYRGIPYAEIVRELINLLAENLPSANATSSTSPSCAISVIYATSTSRCVSVSCLILDSPTKSVLPLPPPPSTDHAKATFLTSSTVPSPPRA